MAVIYKGRPLPGKRKRADIDVRHFVWHRDSILQEVVDGMRCATMTDDEYAVKVQRWVVRHITYRADAKIGCGEYWLMPTETIGLKAGDCEDGAILIATMLRLGGIEADRVWVNAGMVKPSPTAPAGGHAWCVYKADNGLHYTLDWCYYEDSEKALQQRPTLSERAEYFYGKGLWFSFNDAASWTPDQKTTTAHGRVTWP